MLTKQSWKKLSQATATTALSIAILAAFGTSKASAVSLQTFNISGTFGDTNGGVSGRVENFNLENGSFDGIYTVDVDQLPTTTRVRLENWDITLRNSLGVPQRIISSSDILTGVPTSTGTAVGSGYVYREDLEFSSPSVSLSGTEFLRLYIDSDFTGTSVGRQFVNAQGNAVPVYGFWLSQRQLSSFTVTSFKSEPVPEPFTIGGTVIAGAAGLWLKRKQQKSRSSQVV